MKQRFSSLDVTVIAHELSNTLVNLRLANVYDLSSKIFLLKFAKPDHKQSLLVDSGFRCHLTAFARTTAAVPTPFVARLRKYLKTRRVTSVAQVGTDRVIEFQFSDGQYKLFLEFYAGGNIILTDKELQILALLRIVPEGEAQEELRVGLKYLLENRQNYGGTPPLTKERLKSGLQKAVERHDENVVGGKKKKKKAGDALQKALAASITEFPPMLVDHAMRVVEFDSSLKPEVVLQNEELLDLLMKSLEEAQRVIQEITSAATTKGYILAKSAKPNSEAPLGEEGGLLYEDFHPFQPRQLADDPSSKILSFDGFNKTADEFFSSIEGQRLESKLQERELTAQKKIEAARQDQLKRLGGLKEIQTLNERKAGAIQANIDRVQEAMDAVNGLIAQGMDWVEIGKLIELEKKRQNPIAEMIKSLKLQENTITLLLHEGDDDEDDEGYETDSTVSESDDEEESKQPVAKNQEDKRLTVDINLGISVWKNSREYYDSKRSAAFKEQKTLESSSKALKSTEKKIAQDLKKGLKQEKVVLRPIRQQFFFEKFIYFISSDGYLVLGGKDAQQNETLYKKYLRKGDVYVHAELAGACSIVIRNNSADAPIPPSTLSQAGTLAVSSSSAWDSKAGMSAWWVTADQVSKSTPNGDFLPTGSFMINGKKNFLPPAVLLLGFGVLFHISEESKARHVKHRLHDDSMSGESSAAAQSVEHQEKDADDDINEGGNLSDEERSQDDGGVANDHSGDASPSPQPEPDHEDDDSEPEETLSNPLQTKNKDEAISVDPTEQASEDLEKLAMTDDEEDSSPAEQEGAAAQTLAKGKEKATDKKGPTPLPRGKRSKAKKMASKYKDQDEEDRLAAQIVIGAAAGRERAEAEAKAKAQREAELAFQKERRRAQHAKTQTDLAAHEKARKAMLEEGNAAVNDEENENTASLDRLVGTPLPGDEILEVIPVCAPWAAMGKYKYKVKLQPGAQKKGKAVKEILGKWTVDSAGKGKVDEKSEDLERMWPREVELIKALKLEECVGIVPVGKVRVMMAGGSAGAAGGKGKGKGGNGGKGGKKGGR